MQSSVLTGGEEGRQESQEQNEVDHGDFEMVVRKDRLILRGFFFYIIAALLIYRKGSNVFFIISFSRSLSSSQSQWF